jgi:toxin-antitoxin system PIN domain toxin
MNGARRSILLDINVWVAFVSARHPHHALVERNWSTLGDAELSFCRVTQMGLLRLLTNPIVMGREVQDSPTAWETYDYLFREQRAVFLAEPDNLESIWRQSSSGPAFSRHRWTDAYLAAFAQAAGVTLLTLDSGFKKFDGLEVLLWS